MASVNWYKMNSPSEVKAVLRHCDIEERLKHEHSNLSIQKENTPFNIQFGESYEKTCKDFDDKLTKCKEAGRTRFRKDSVLAVSLDVTVPDGISQDEKTQWFEDCLETMKNTCGGHFLNAYIHVDEIHEYTGKDKNKHISKEHMHAVFMPETEENRLCCREYSARRNIVKLNNAIEEMTNEKYHVKFNTGEKKKGNSVDKEKYDSMVREAEMEAERIMFQAEHDSSQVRAEADSYARETKEQADSYAREIREQADEYAEEVRSGMRDTLEKLNSTRNRINGLHNDYKTYLDIFSKLRNRFKQGSKERKFIDDCLNNDSKFNAYRNVLNSQVDELNESIGKNNIIDENKEY